MNIILDIDETLIYFINSKYRKHSWDKLSSEEQAKYEFYSKGPNANVVIIRPYIREFLRYLFRYFRVSLWTLSDREYAQGIADMLLKLLGGKSAAYRFAHIFSADDDDDHETGASGMNGNNKDLNWLWYQYPDLYPCFAECNTILIDDLPNNALNKANRHNSIKIDPFALFGEVKARTDPYEDVSKDDVLKQIVELLKVVRKYQKNCYNIEDFREYWVFNDKNVKLMKLDKYYKPQLWRRQRFHSISVERTPMLPSEMPLVPVKRKGTRSVTITTAADAIKAPRRPTL